MMLPRIIFFTAVSAATLAVILLALVASPSANRKRPQKNHSRQFQAITLYMQQPDLPNQNSDSRLQSESAIIFHHTLTEGPENSSRTVGKAQGFIIPIQHFAHSAFNIIYLTFNTPEYSGSLGVDAKQLQWHDVKQELMVVGGTGSFAFARGFALFTKMEDNQNAMYQVKLPLRFPSISDTTIPG